MKDVSVVLDYIKQCEFADYIDFDNLVALGHSLGGISAIEMAQVFNEDFKA